MFASGNAMSGANPDESPHQVEVIDDSEENSQRDAEIDQQNVMKDGLRIEVIKQDSFQNNQ